MCYNEPMKLMPLDLAVLGLYLGGIVGLGTWAGRRDRDTDDYFVAGRRLPGCSGSRRRVRFSLPSRLPVAALPPSVHGALALRW